MWYRIDWMENSTLTITSSEHIEANDLVEALTIAAKSISMTDLGGSCYVMRVAGPATGSDFRRY